MKIKIVVMASGIFALAGTVLQFWNPQLGILFIGYSILLAVTAGLLLLRLIQKRIIKHERMLGQIQRTASDTKMETLKFGTSIFKRVDRAEYNHSPSGSSSLAPKTINTDEQPTEKPNFQAGRAATPEVANPFTNESFTSMLNPDREPSVSGIFGDLFPAGISQRQWRPGQVLEQLETARPDSIVLDEKEINHSPVWSRSFTSVGTALMKELTQAIAWARQHQIPVYLIPADQVTTDIHTSKLRGPAVIELPLDDSQSASAFGGPRSQLVTIVNTIASQRLGESA